MTLLEFDTYLEKLELFRYHSKSSIQDELCDALGFSAILVDRSQHNKEQGAPVWDYELQMNLSVKCPKSNELIDLYVSIFYLKDLCGHYVITETRTDLETYTYFEIQSFPYMYWSKYEIVGVARD